MPELSGKELRIRVSDTPITSPTDGVELRGISKSSEKEACDLKDVTAFGDTSGRQVAGVVKYELKLDGYFYTDDQGQVKLKVGTTKYIGLWYSGYGNAGECFPMIISEREHSAEVDGIQEVSFSCSGNGEPTDIAVGD